MKTRNLFWLSAALLMAACTNEEDISMVSSSAIQFNAAISESRVTNEAWEVGDEIGISMKVGDAVTVNNKLYTAKSTSGTFQTDGEALCFPDETEGNVTFYAYYPYDENPAVDNTITFGVDGKTDVLWTKQDATEAEKASNTVQLSFSHALSKVILETVTFPDDIEVTLSESCSQATLDITTGTVTAGTAEEGYSVELVKGSDGKYSAIVLPCTSTSKTLTIASVSLEKQWTYTISSATYEGGYQYAYKATFSDTGIQFEQNGIKGWEGNISSPTNLEGGIESEIPTTIAKELVGKYYTPDTNYYFDEVDTSTGIGWTSESTFGNNYDTSWQWSADMFNQCQNTTLHFYEGEDGQLMVDRYWTNYVDSKDGVTNGQGITVTVDETNKTLTFNRTIIDYLYAYNNNLVEEGTGQKFMMFVKNADDTDAPYSFTFNTAVTNVRDLFANNRIYLAYSYIDGNSNEKYRVAALVECDDPTSKQW